LGWEREWEERGGEERGNRDTYGEENDEISDLEEGGEVQVVDANEGDGGAGDEDAELVEEGVHGIELAIFCEGSVFYWEEKGGRDALIYGVFCNVD
jgi:hypothetical protein